MVLGSPHLRREDICTDCSEIEQKENEIYKEIINKKNGTTPEKFGTVEAILIRRLAKLECMLEQK
jgi:hypothetical protein